MEAFQNPNTTNRWKCSKCNTYSSSQARQCSWCGAGKPGTRDIATTTESKSTPDAIKREQTVLNKIRNLVSKLAVEQKEELLEHIEKTYRI